MKALSDKTIDVMEEVALDGALHLKTFFAYTGSNPIYMTKGKLGAAAIGGYARLRAGESSRMAVELAYKRATGRKQATGKGKKKKAA